MFYFAHAAQPGGFSAPPATLAGNVVSLREAVKCYTSHMQLNQVDSLLHPPLSRFLSRVPRILGYQCFLLLPLCVLASGQAIYSSSQQVQEIINKSKTLRELLHEIKSYGYVDIPIIQDLSFTGAAQGFSSPKSTPKGPVYVVHVSTGSDDFVGNVIAHELLHASLRHEGFYSAPASIVHGTELNAKDLKAMEYAATKLVNCYQDAEINRRMLKLRLRPQLLEDDNKAALIAEANSVPRAPIYKRLIALDMYCVSIQPNFGMEEIYFAFKSWYPELSQEVRALTNVVGQEPCDTGKSCFTKMIKLRKAISLEDQIKFISPLTLRRE